jgi:hypothetical protein
VNETELNGLALAQAQRHVSEIEAAIAEANRVLGILRKGSNAARLSRHASRRRTQIAALEQELGELHGMRFELRTRFGV